ncbi:hypothetical protein [Arcticibacter sp.]|jgi:hypothetical protein|uniref:hypothetical protein n=1 Tax=Arcticibacter sp. TaxID=1872630 RepID=UPI00388E5615
MNHTEMELERPEEYVGQAVLKIDDTRYTVNIEEVEAFISHCKKFMPLHHNSDFELMTQEISDSLIEFTRGDVTMEQIRPQLLFLREVGFLLKGLLTPVEEN